jgi:hypothetical protein
LQCRELGYPEVEAWLRTNPNNPVAEPGGSMWAYRGLQDGFSLDGTRITPPQPGHGLNLPNLDRLATCTAK